MSLLGQFGGRGLPVCAVLDGCAGRAPCLPAEWHAHVRTRSLDQRDQGSSAHSCSSHTLARSRLA
eukprot:4172410-Pleurochrysis_carterae.AAC.1